jgi:hypothetical protein
MDLDPDPDPGGPTLVSLTFSPFRIKTKMSGAPYSCVLMSCSGNSANAFSFYKVFELPASIHRIGKQIRKELKLEPTIQSSSLFRKSQMLR